MNVSMALAMQKLPLAKWMIHPARGSFCIASAMLTFMSGYYLGADWKSMFIEHLLDLLPKAFPNRIIPPQRIPELLPPPRAFPTPPLQ
jgi:hypothetical protein